MRRVLVLVVGVLLAGCGSDDKKPAAATQPPASVSANQPLRTLDAAMAPLADYLRQLDDCADCGSKERADAIAALGGAGNELFQVANSTAGADCTQAAGDLADTVVSLRVSLETSAPPDADKVAAAVDRVERGAEAYASGCAP